MKPTDFEQANTIYLPPKELDESQCHKIPAFVGPILGGNLDGSNAIIVAWKPSEEELNELIEGDGIIYLMCIGGLPPHVLLTKFPNLYEI